MINKISTLHCKSKNFFNEQLAKHDITYRQGRIMALIAENPGISQSKLCEAIKLDKGTVAKVILKLEEDNYITKEINPNDSRSFYIYPSDSLLEIIPEFKDVKKSWDEILTKGLSDIEIQIFKELLNRAEKNALEYFK